MRYDTIAPDSKRVISVLGSTIAGRVLQVNSWGEP